MDISSKKVMAIVKEIMEDPTINCYLEVFVKVKVKQDDGKAGRAGRTVRSQPPSSKNRAYYPFPVRKNNNESDPNMDEVTKGWSFEDIYKDVEVSILIACSKLYFENTSTAFISTA